MCLLGKNPNSRWAQRSAFAFFALTFAGDLCSISGLARSSGEGKGCPLQYSGLENSMDCIVHGVTQSWTGLSDFHFHFLVLWVKKPQTDPTDVNVHLWLPTSSGLCLPVSSAAETLALHNHFILFPSDLWHFLFPVLKFSADYVPHFTEKVDVFK